MFMCSFINHVTSNTLATCRASMYIHIAVSVHHHYFTVVIEAWPLAYLGLV